MKYNLLFLVVLYFLIVVYRLLPIGITQPLKPTIRIAGGIVPHHLYVQDIISDFFKNIKIDNVDKVIIVGPNHQELGDHKIIFNPIFDDQSLTAIIPFAKNTFPNAQITGIVLKHNIALSECRDLANQIMAIPGNKLVIASIDFSHYLTSDQAEINDTVMIRKIKNRDYEAILDLSSDYLDSPASLVTALIYFDGLKASNMKILTNTNSGRRGNPFAPTTSYFSIVFYEQS